MSAPGASAAASFAGIEERLGHRFSDRDLVRVAFVHRSYLAEHPGQESYERLEFLGDAVLQLAVTEYLYLNHPHLQEGHMAKVRAAVVNEQVLATIARRLGLANALLLGRGEELTGGREKESILADVTESLLGAAYLDAGYETVRELVTRHWALLVDERAESPGRRDYKTRLQEMLARQGLQPRYEISESGPEHAKEFRADVFAADEMLGTGHGTSKKRAEQDAARVATEQLRRSGPAMPSPPPGDA